MSIHIPADISNPGYDILGNPLTNPGGYANNGACSTIQSPTATQLLDKIEVYVAGTPFDASYATDLNTKAKYEDGSDSVYWDGSNWIVAIGSLGTSTHLTANGQYPPKAGWPDIAGLTVSVDYDSKRIDDDGNLVAVSLAEELAFVNGPDNNLNQFEKVGPNDTCVLKEQIHGAQGYTDALLADPSAFYQAERWVEKYTDSCGAGFMAGSGFDSGFDTGFGH